MKAEYCQVEYSDFEVEYSASPEQPTSLVTQMAVLVQTMYFFLCSESGGVYSQTPCLDL
jgi:hypothetical protein